MKFFIGDKLYDYSEEQLSIQMLNHGDEADVYRIKGQAVKIYKQFCPKKRLDEKTVKYFKTINTNRLLLPIDTVYDENISFNGYTTKLIEEGNKQTISRMKASKFIKEMQLLTEDTKLLTELGITVDDFQYSDVLYGDGLYYCDPGSYQIEKNISSRKIKEFNKEQLHNLIIDEILGPTCKLTKKQKNKLKEMTLSGEYISDIFSYEEYKEKESVSQFIKRITK